MVGRVSAAQNEDLLTQRRDAIEREFCAALAAGDVDAVDALLPKVIKVKPRLLFRAIEAADLEQVRALVDAGIPLEGRHMGGTPLLMALFELTEIAALPELKDKAARLLAIVHLLLERGADVHARAPDGAGVLRLVSTLQDTALADELRRRGAEP